MRLDQIKAQEVLEAVDAFLDAIDKRQDSMCAVASSFRDGKTFRIFDKKKGGFNQCYFLEEVDDVENTPGEDTPGEETPGEEIIKTRDRVVLRIPQMPRLGFPEEKLRSEIGAMKWVAHSHAQIMPLL